MGTSHLQVENTLNTAPNGALIIAGVLIVGVIIGWFGASLRWGKIKIGRWRE